MFKFLQLEWRRAGITVGIILVLHISLRPSSWKLMKDTSSGGRKTTMGIMLLSGLQNLRNPQPWTAVGLKLPPGAEPQTGSSGSSATILVGIFNFLGLKFMMSKVRLQIRQPLRTSGLKEWGWWDRESFPSDLPQFTLLSVKENDIKVNIRLIFFNGNNSHPGTTEVSCTKIFLVMLILRAKIWKQIVWLIKSLLPDIM